MDEIEANREEWTRHINFEDHVRPLAVATDGYRISVQPSRMPGFHVVDVDRWQVADTIAMPGMADGSQPPCEDKYPFTIYHIVEITPDQKDLNSLCTTGAFAAVYSYPDLQFVQRIELGRQPSYLTVSKDSKLAYISCRASCQLRISSLESFETVHIIERVGAVPQRVCVDH